MKPATVQKIVDLNRQFYQTFAIQFSATRQRLQPGVRQLIPRMLTSASILDIGCGNGELARQIGNSAYTGSYVGLDFSAGLLEEARKNLPAGLQSRFFQADLAQPGWEAALRGNKFAVVLAFAVLHQVKLGQITSSPGFTPSIKSAKNRAEVQELTVAT